jgi:hypothetical protein
VSDAASIAVTDALIVVPAGFIIVTIGIIVGLMSNPAGTTWMYCPAVGVYSPRGMFDMFDCHVSTPADVACSTIPSAAGGASGNVYVMSAAWAAALNAV